MGRTGFRIDDILKATTSRKNPTYEFGEYMKKLTESRRWSSLAGRGMLTEPATGSNFLWLQLYWESLRQYYVSLSLDGRLRMTPAYHSALPRAENFDLSFFPKVKTSSDVDISSESGKCKLDTIKESNKDDELSLYSSKFPNDSPLFELEKLATTNLSTWNSEFCPIKSLLEKKVATQSRRRKSRTAFTAHQLSELEKVFRKQKYLTPSDRDRIAKLLNLSSPQVITWFQNRRAKFKRDLEEMQNDLLYATKMEKHEIPYSSIKNQDHPATLHVSEKAKA